MVVGFLRKGKTYRAPCRWYPDGPIGTIEYYVAAPGAKYYEGDHVFFPLAFFAADGQGGDVGELTGEGHSREFDSSIPAATEPGLGYSGTAADFRGETPYPGTSPAVEVPCVPAPRNVSELILETRTVDVSIEEPVTNEPVYTCFRLPGGAYSIRRVTFSGIVGVSGYESLSNMNGVWDIVSTGGCSWSATNGMEYGNLFLNAITGNEWKLTVGPVEYQAAYPNGYDDVVLTRTVFNPLLFVVPPPPTILLTIP